MPSIFALSANLALSAAPYVAGMRAAADVTEAFTETVADAVASSIKLGGNFEAVENSLKVFSGSMRRAKSELAEVDRIAKNTVGLRLVTAEQGYQRLRSLGFEATRTRDLIKELGEEKILSATTDENLQRVIFNFTQIASGGQRISQEIRELLTAMPSLKRAFVDAFGTLDPKKIQAFVDADPNKFFDKLIESMKKGEAATGGFNDAQGKFYDQLIRSAREFSQPFLPELTTSIRELTRDLEDNKDLFAEWGENVGRWLTFVSNIGETRLFSLARRIQDLSGRGVALISTFGLSGGSNFGEIAGGVRAFADKVGITTKGKDYLTGETIQSKAIKDANRQAQEAVDAAKEAVVDIANAELDASQAVQRAISAQLASIESYYNDRVSIIDNAFQIEEARLTSHLDFTLESEISTLKAVSSAKSKSINQQIKEANFYYSNLLSLNNGNSAEIEKITLEKNQTLRDLNKQLIVNEFNTQKQIAEKEKQILDKRREALIEFKNLQIRQSQFNLDVKAFDVSRTQTGFDELINLTNQSYAEISRLTIESYQLQLQDLSITREQRFNLTRQMYLDEQKLAEENRRAILDIQKNQYQEEARLITQAADFMRSSADVRASISSRLIQEFNEGWNFAFPDFLDNFGSQLIQESDAVINSLKDKINSAKEDLLDLKTFPDEVYKKYDLVTKEQMQGAQSYIESAIGAMGAEIRMLEAQGRDIRTATNFIGQAVGDYLEKFEQLKNRFGKLNTNNLIDYKLGLNTISEDDELKKIDAKIQRLTELKTKAEQLAPFEAEKIALDIVELENQKADTIAAFAQKRIDIVKQSAEGLKLVLGDIKNGGDNAVFIQEAAQAQTIREIVSGYQEIASLKERIKNLDEFQYLDIEKAKLLEIINLRNLETQKIIQGNQSLEYRLQMMSAQLPTFATQLNDSYAQAIEGISSTIANAVTEWDGTFQGFLKSIARGFAQTAQAIINELIRIMIYKAILSFISALSGGGGGDPGVDASGLSSAGGLGPALGGGGVHAASGGYISGRGTGTSDSIKAMLSNGEFVMKAAAVDKYGAGFFNSLNNLQTPMIAPVVSGSSSSKTENHIQIAPTIVIKGAENPQQTAQVVNRSMSQISKELGKEMLRQLNR